jgi:uncharacterized RDD family membrane protein YckC
MKVHSAARITFRPAQCPACQYYVDAQRCRAYARPSSPTPLLAVLVGETDQRCARFSSLQAGQARVARPHHPTSPSPPSPPPSARQVEVWEQRAEGVGVRFSAFFFDLIAIALIATIPSVGMRFLDIRPGAAGQSVQDWQAMQVWVSAASIYIVSVLYFTLLEGGFGTTLGKVIGAWPAASLKVVRKDGTRCGFGRAAIRALLWPFEAFLVGALVVWLTESNQRVGDLIAGTIVVNKWKLRTIRFQHNSALFEFAGGRRIPVDRLLRAELTNWLRTSSMKLEGIAPDGRRVRIGHLRFPSAGTRDRVRFELEQFFRVSFTERVQWWRLILILVVLLLTVLAILVVLTTTSPQNLPALFR